MSPRLLRTKNWPSLSAFRGIAILPPHRLATAAEIVEVVDEQPAHVSLDRLVDIADGNALLQGLVAIDVDKPLRNVGRNVVRDHADFRPLASRRHELAQIVRKKLNIACRRGLPARTGIRQKCRRPVSPAARN